MCIRDRYGGCGSFGSDHVGDQLRPHVGSRRHSKMSPGHGPGPPPNSTVRSVARHVDAGDLHDGVLVTLSSACVVGVELVVDATCTSDLVVVHIGRAFLALHAVSYT